MNSKFKNRMKVSAFITTEHKILEQFSGCSTGCGTLVFWLMGNWNMNSWRLWSLNSLVVPHFAQTECY